MARDGHSGARRSASGCGCCPVTDVGFPRLWTNPHGTQTVIRALPRRIVALEPARITECLLALGVVPVGSATCEDLRTLKRGQWPSALRFHVPPGVVDVGWCHDPPDVARIRAVSPDLILAIGGEDDRDSEERRLRESPLSAVAPTILLPDRRSVGDRPAFIERLRALAWLTDRQERAEMLLAGYEARCAMLRPLVDGEMFAAVWLRGDKIAIFTRHHTSQVFTDLGIGLEEPPGEPVWPSDDQPRARAIGFDGLAVLQSPTFVVAPRHVDATTIAGFLVDHRWARHPTVAAGNADFLGWPLLAGGYFSSHAQLDAVERLLQVTAAAARAGPSVIRVGARAARNMISWSVQGPALDDEAWIGGRDDRRIVLKGEAQTGQLPLAGERAEAVLRNSRLWVTDRDGLHDFVLVPDSAELALQ